MTRHPPRAANDTPHLVVSAEVLERLCAKGLVQRTFLRLSPERRAAVVDAAVEEASIHGPAQLNIKEVARRAKIPVGSLYQYFDSREALIGFIGAVAAGELSTLLETYGPQLAELPFAQGLRIYLNEAIAWSRKQPTLLRLYVVAAYGLAAGTGTGADGNADLAVVEPIAQAMQQVIRAMVVAAKQRGELRDDVDTEDTCRLVNVLLIAVTDAALLPGLNAYYRLYDEDSAVARTLDATVDMITKGVVGLGGKSKIDRQKKKP